MNPPPPHDAGLPPPAPPPPSLFLRLTRFAASLVLGLLVGVLAHYLIYRLSLPSKPFIHVAL